MYQFHSPIYVCVDIYQHVEIELVLFFNFSKSYISAVWRAIELKFKSYAKYFQIYYWNLFWQQNDKVWFGRFTYGSHLGFLNVDISAVWRATGLKFGIQAYYPQIYYWYSFFTYIGHLGFFSSKGYISAVLRATGLKFKI